MSTILNCSTVLFGENSYVGTMNSVSSYELSNSSLSSQESREPMTYQAMQFQGIQDFLTTTTNFPYLKVIEEPVEKFRFRYKSEMMGTHGSILAKSHERNRRKIYPTVKLWNYDGPAVIRCSLYTAHPDPQKRTPHTHRLIVRAENNSDKDDPHEVVVSQDNDYTAIFHGMGIIHTAKKNIVDELIKKKRTRLLDKLRAHNGNITSLTTSQEAQLRQEAEEESRKMNLNSVSLRFEAYIRDSNNCLHEICDAVFSKPINNMKSALTGELKICRIDKNSSSCLGGEEIFILVEKVGKKNIKIKFFEVDEDDNEIWCDYGKFTELDVHHQYAIVFRTPPYRDHDIDKSVKVFLQLFRPTDGDSSEPHEFTYKPRDRIGKSRKRQRINNDSLNSDEHSGRFVNLINGLANNNIEMRDDTVVEPTDNFPSLGNLSEVLGNNAGMNSSDFKEFMENIEKDLNLPQTQNGLGTVNSEYSKMPVKYDLDPACTAAYVCNLSDITFPGGLKTEGIVACGDFFSLLSHNEVSDLVSDGEPIVPTKRRGTHKFNRKLWKLKEKKKSDDNSTVEVKKEPTGDILDKSLNDLDRILKEDKGSKVLLSKKIKEMFDERNEEGGNALHTAVTTERTDALEIFLQVLEKEGHTDIINLQNCNVETPLHLAVLHNHPVMVQMLVRRGADPNVRDRSGNNAIHVAVRNCHNLCLAEILEKKNYSKNRSVLPNLNAKNDYGEAPLHLAALSHNLEAVKLLVKGGANVNEVDSTFGRHILLVAAEQGHRDIIEYLVKETNVDVNMSNFAGNTALHYACVIDGRGSADICKLLIDAKADPHIVNSEQRSKTATIQASLGFPSLINPQIKEEIESEDDLQLRIDVQEEDEEEKEEEEDDDDEEEDDDDEDDEEEEDEDSKGQSSMDLAWNNKEILEILKKAEVTNSVLCDIDIKKECASPESVADNGLFDEEALTKLCTILDSSNVWINLADLLDYTFLVPSIRSATSPTKLLFNYADLHGNVTVQNIRSFLEALDETEAVEVIDQMLARRVSSGESP